MNPSHIELVTNVVLAIALVAAVVIDIRSRRIPNAITAPVALLGLALGAAGGGWAGFQDSLAGLGLGLALLLPAWFAGGIGAGDVKLLGMIGALRGVQFVIWTGLSGGIAGGLLALLAIASRRGGSLILQNVGAYLFRSVVLRVPGKLEPTSSSFRMSYALAIALGALAAHLWW